MSFLTTISGRKVDYENPDPNEIYIEDIAHGLAHTCRYAGQVPYHYSVAQHSLLVAQLVWMMSGSEVAALGGLMHDASEAYIVDIPAPLKHLECMAGYRAVEERLMRVISEKYRFWAGSPIVHIADKMAYKMERDGIFHHKDVDKEKVKVMKAEFLHGPWDPGFAKMKFMDAFKLYSGSSVDRAASS